MSYLEAFKKDDIAPGQLKAKDLAGKSVAVANVDGTFYAFDDTCTHRQCSLSEGCLEDNVVECPCHGGKFDVKTGEVLALPPVIPVKTYPVKVENGNVLVDL